MIVVNAEAWDRVDVSGWPVLRAEQAGSTENLWLEEPTTEQRWLHKDTVIPQNGLEQGEDWSEIISTQVADLLGVPCAATRLCERNGRRGSLSLSVVPEGHDLWEGSVILERADAPGYFSHREGAPGVDPVRPKVKRPGHSLANIRTVLGGIAAPPGFGGPAGMDGFDVFAGYTLFDALVANTDRHEQNWAVLVPRLTSEPERLASSYDHASRLGFNLPDSQRWPRIADPNALRAWVERGRARRFEHVGSPPSLVEHAAAAVVKCSAEGANWWRERLSTLNIEPLTEALMAGVIPEMSDLAVKFVVAVLTVNLRRLQDAIVDRA